MSINFILYPGCQLSPSTVSFFTCTTVCFTTILLRCKNRSSHAMLYFSSPDEAFLFGTLILTRIGSISMDHQVFTIISRTVSGSCSAKETECIIAKNIEWNVTERHQGFFTLNRHADRLNFDFLHNDWQKSPMTFATEVLHLHLPCKINSALQHVN